MAVQCLGYVIHPDEIAQCVSLLGKAAFCTRLCCARPSTRNRSMIWQSIDFFILRANFVAALQIGKCLTITSVRDMVCFTCSRTKRWVGEGVDNLRFASNLDEQYAAFMS